MNKPLEKDIHISIAQWLDWQNIDGSQFMFHSPNGAWMKNMGIVKNMKKQGMKNGVWDWIWVKKTCCYSGFACEVKRDSKFKMSPEQIAFGKWIQSQGFYCCIVWTLEMFQKHLEIFLKSANEKK